MCQRGGRASTGHIRSTCSFQSRSVVDATDYSMQLSSRCNFQSRSVVDQQVFVKANLVWTIRLCGTDKFRESALRIKLTL